MDELLSRKVFQDLRRNEKRVKLVIYQVTEACAQKGFWQRVDRWFMI